MRIVKFDEFIQLPIGTVYGFYSPCYTNDFVFKGNKQDFLLNIWKTFIKW